MQHQNHAMQLRAIAADDTGIERRDQGFPSGVSQRSRL